MNRNWYLKLNHSTHIIVLVAKFYAQFLHSIYNDLESTQDVVEYDGAPFFLLRLGEALRIDQSHLLEDSRLSALSSACATYV